MYILSNLIDKLSTILIYVKRVMESDPCRFCREIHNNDTTCSICYNEGHCSERHEYDGECLFCGEEHSARDHLCDICGFDGHDKDIESCIKKINEKSDNEIRKLKESIKEFKDRSDTEMEELRELIKELKGKVSKFKKFVK